MGMGSCKNNECHFFTKNVELMYIRLIYNPDTYRPVTCYGVSTKTVRTNTNTAVVTM